MKKMSKSPIKRSGVDTSFGAKGLPAQKGASSKASGPSAGRTAHTPVGPTKTGTASTLFFGAKGLPSQS